MSLALESRLALSPSVTLRPEPFGALAYHFESRRLTFLKRPELVRVVEMLDGRTSVGEALDATGIPPEQWTSYLAALTTLVEADMLNLEVAHDA